MPVDPANILAASPVFGGPLTSPYRIIMHRKGDGNLVVHSQAVQFTDAGEIEGLYEFDGSYITPHTKGDQSPEERATERWMERVTREMARGPKCKIVTARRSSEIANAAVG